MKDDIFLIRIKESTLYEKPITFWFLNVNHKSKTNYDCVKISLIYIIYYLIILNLLLLKWFKHFTAFGRVRLYRLK